MSWWKQAIACVVILIAAAAMWYSFFPGAKQTAAEWGFGTAVTETAGPRNGPGPMGGLGGAGPGLVILEPVETATINDRLSAIGTGNALHTVAVRAYSSGRLTDILVDAGGEVQAGDVIARMDADSERIAVDRAELALEDSQAKLERANALLSSNTITAVQVRDAELALRNAELQLREAKLALARREIPAPISGTVGILAVSAGDYITTTSDIATIDDRSEILIDFWVPEQYVRQIKVGASMNAQSIGQPDENYHGIVSAIDNQVDNVSRTLRIQARISNPSDTLRSGMAFRIDMQFDGDQYPAVNPLAVQWSNEGAFVWIVRSNLVTRLPVQVMQRNADNVLVSGGFMPDDQVVVEGVQALRDGQSLPVADNANESRPRRGS